MARRSDGIAAVSAGRRRWRREVALRLLRWYARACRDLPWRRDPSPYRVLVSELMLQQTQLDRVIGYFERFVAAFPDIESLARAPHEEVVALWSGLGYYGRARRLHAAAQTVVARFGGRFPDTSRDVLSLPGVGRYTAGAILSIAFNLPVPAVDGNAQRVLTRLLALGGDPGLAGARRALWSEAEALLPEGRARDFNQALMELGALVCLPAGPLCSSCPVDSLCRARRQGNPERYPEKPPARRSVRIEMAAAAVARGSRVLLTFTPAGGDASAPAYLRGLWNFPLLEVATPADAPGALEQLIEREWGGRVRLGERLGTARHAITFRRITVHVWRGEVVRAPRGRQARVGPRWEWVAPADLGTRYAVPSLAWKILGKLRDPAQGDPPRGR
jgi:A/G-specific adenine glycosylase